MIRHHRFLIVFSTFCFFSFLPSKYALLSKDSTSGNEPQFLPIEAIICFQKNKCVFLEVANKLQQRSKGLMFRRSLKENYGMLFKFNNFVNIDIWMKNTLFPLDVIFIRGNRIVNIYENLHPCNAKNCEKFNSKFKVDKIIELKAGTVKKFNIQVGKNVEINDL